MPRPISERRLGAPIPPRIMKPAGIFTYDLEEVILGFDEAEAIRLADFDGLYQDAAARSMGVSRQTFGNIIESARHKVADALLHGKVLRIEGGEISIRTQDESIMRIAVPSKDGVLDQHFGQAKEFLLFKVNGQDLIDEGILVAPEGRGCKSGIGSELAKRGVIHVVAGNMGEGAARVLGANAIRVVRGASGDAREAALAFVRGTIVDSGISCTIRNEEGGCNYPLKAAKVNEEAVPH